MRLQLRGDAICDEDQTDTPALEVRADRRPERFDVAVGADEVSQPIGGIHAAYGAVGLVCRAHRVDGPVDDSVGCVVEQLPDDLAADTRVAAAFDFHQRRDAVLVKEGVVDVANAAFLAGHCDLA